MSPLAVVPEWKILSSAYLTTTLDGVEARQEMNKLKCLFKKVAAESESRLRVCNSTVQVR